MKTTEYTPESTYFEEREQRLMQEIEDAKAEIDAAQTSFAKRSADLSERRDAILSATADLRSKRSDLNVRAERARTSIAELGALAVRCETLVAELDGILKDDLATISALEAEITSIEIEKTKKIRRPGHDIEKLEARLERLKLRRDLAARRPNPKPERVLLVEGSKTVDRTTVDHILARSSER